MDLPDELGRRSASQGGPGHVPAFRPLLFDSGTPSGQEGLEALLAGGQVRAVHDALEEQLLDLAMAEAPRRTVSAAERRAAVERELGGRPRWQYGVWAFFPWTGDLVHLLPEPRFRALRADRNRYKILPEEQAALRSRRIGIAGLSVGQATALTLAMEGVGGHFRLADFDTLSLSNLNRLRARVAELGVNKAVLAARAIAEIDPFAEVAVFPAGITDATLDAFFLEGGKLDLLVEECDDLEIKVRLRERARQLRIPVVMETSDRGLLDVERFDLEPGRPLFHGLLGEVDASRLRGLSTKDKVPFVLRILGDQALSPALAASLMEVEETLYTWPQLASAVALGGAVVTDVARRILTGKLSASGRYYVDLEALVREGTAVPLGEAGALAPEAPEEARRPARPPPPRPARGRDAPSREELDYLVAHAVVAPSGGNVQPWRFSLSGGRLRCQVDEGRAGTLLDFGGLASQMSLGAAVENILLAAPGIGLTPSLELVPDGRWVAAELSFARAGEDLRHPLLDAVFSRVSNRRHGDGSPLGPEALEAVRRAAAPFQAQLHLASTPDALQRVARLVGAADRICAFCQDLHRELMGEIRWSREQTLSTRDGLDLATLELSAADAAGMRVASSWLAMRQLKRLGGGRVLEKSGAAAVRSASAAGVLSVGGTSPGDYFRGGRALQRVWLTATQQGLSLTPHSTLPYLFARLERGGGAGLDEDTRRELEALRPAYREVFGVQQGDAEILLFRVGRGGAPSAIALRRPVEDFWIASRPG